MSKKFTLIIFLCLTIKIYGQQEKLDTFQLNLFATSIDRVEAEGKNIMDFIVRKYRHTGYYVDIHYIVDTLSKILLKCGYCEYYEENFNDTVLYKTTFYFDHGDFKLAHLLTASKGNQVPQGKLYFTNKHGQVAQVLHITNSKAWDLKRIQEKTKEFLLDFAGIVAMIERRKNSS
jgi:hypothetical protein